MPTPPLSLHRPTPPPSRRGLAPWGSLSLTLGLAVAWLGHANTALADFTAIDPLAGQTRTDVNGVSADGRTVVGVSGGTDPAYAIRWTAAEGTVSLGGVADAAFAVSADGRRIGGGGYLRGGFLWDAATGYQTGYGDHLSAIAADGQTWGANGYVSTAGTTTYLGGNGTAGLSADGSLALITSSVGYIGGYTSYDTYLGNAGDGLTNIGHGLSGNQTLGTALSADGSRIVGIEAGAAYLRYGEAFTWTAAGGFVELGKLFAGGYSAAAALTNTGYLGAMIVGNSGPADGFDSLNSHAFLWTAADGMVDLRAFLAGHGLAADLAGWTLTNATGISADGRTIVGNGIDPDGATRGWVAILNPVPEPASLALLGLGVAGLVGLRRRSRSALAR